MIVWLHELPWGQILISLKSQLITTIDANFITILFISRNLYNQMKLCTIPWFVSFPFYFLFYFYFLVPLLFSLSLFLFSMITREGEYIYIYNIDMISFQFLSTTLHKKSLTFKKNHYFINNLRPNKRSKLFKIPPYYWPHNKIERNDKLQETKLSFNIFTKKSLDLACIDFLNENDY